MNRPLCRLGAALLILTLTPLRAQDPKSPPAAAPKSAFDFLKSEHDKNHDGRISAEEYPRGAERFARLDLDRDGVLTAADFETNADADRRGAARARGRAREQTPKPGEGAPDFTLKTKDGKSAVTLSSFASKRPVALIFGSWT